METFVSMLMTPLMAVEILAAEFIVAKFFHRRNYFYLRFFGSACLTVFITVWIEVMYFLITGNHFNYGTSTVAGEVAFKIFYYITIFVMTIGCVAFSYKQSLIVVLVCCSIGYAVQYLASSFALLIKAVAENAKMSFGTVYEVIAWFFSRGAVYFICAFILRNKGFEEEFYRGNNRNKAFLCFLAVLIFICLSRFSNDDPSRSNLAKIVEPIYAMLCSAFIIAVETSMAKNDVISKELSDAKLLLRQEREQYLLAKENIEIINEKCHDLKHQIAFLHRDKSDKYISEIEKAVMIYDSTVKTGSAVLDTLLTEKKLQCESKNIELTTVVNGKLLEFIDEMELYSLLGNALSNAIESVSLIDDESKRHIALKVKRIGDMCSIHIENPYVGEIIFEDGLPQTLKNKDWHGFGMKSMNRIVSSYGGVMTVTAKDGLFSLDMLMPTDGQ